MDPHDGLLPSQAGTCPLEGVVPHDGLLPGLAGTLPLEGVVSIWMSLRFPQRLSRLPWQDQFSSVPPSLQACCAER